MKSSFARRVLVGVITLTTMFSSLGSSVVYAGDGDENVAVVSMAEESEVASEEVTDFVVTESEDTSVEVTEEVGEEVYEETSQEVTEVVNEEISEEASEAAGDDSEISESSDSAADTNTIDVQDEEAADLATSAVTEAASDASSEDVSLSEEDASDAASSEESVLDVRRAILGASLVRSSGASTIVADLSNPKFGEITDAFAEQTVISSTEQEIAVGFSFKIYNAESIPDGKFTYTLPSSLDFSKAVGLYIPVIEIVDENGVQKEVEIGSARVSADNVMSFEIRTDDLEKKPNGLMGSVGFKCRINPGSVQGDGTVDIAFSDTKHVQVVVQEPVISGEKGDVKIVSGKATWKVNFNVSADVDNFEITDVLGDNLMFNGGFKLSGEGQTINSDFETSGDHTLKVHVGHISRGSYTLEYGVKALSNFSTDGMSEEEIFAKGNGNTVSWNWNGATKPGQDTGYATMKDNKLVKKYGKNMSTSGTVTSEGRTGWEVYINNGASPDDISGYTFVDVLDAGMEFDASTIKVMISSDGKYWKDYNGFTPVLEEVNGQWQLKIDFPENTPVSYYKLTYSSKIRGELPHTKTTYTNKAYMYKDGEPVDEDSRESVYKYSGSFTSTIDKDITEERDSKGFVSWVSHFNISGDKSSYQATITDTISPDDANKTINGKAVSAKIVPDSVVVYKILEDGTQKKLPSAHTTITVTDNQYKIVAKNLSAGDYVIYYKTQDFYGNESDNVHSYPQGSAVKFNNKIQIKIDSVVMSDSKSYEVTSDGLPMMKEASSGYYDSEAGAYVIPWKVVVNRNSIGQTNTSVAAGMEAEVVDFLPDNLSYRQGSAKIGKLGGETFATTEPEVTKAGGKTELKWTFTWPDGMSGADNACVVAFDAVVDKDFFAGLVNGGNSDIAMSFDNTVTGNVGGITGKTNASSADSLTLLDKRAAYNEKEQLIDYSIVVNDGALDLVDGDVLVLSDDITNGFYVSGSLHVYEYVNGAKGAVVIIDPAKVTNGGASVEIAVPDSMALIVEYQVRANTSVGEDIGDGKVKVSVSNTATLHGKVTKADTSEGDYIFNKVTANITSSKGAIRITKVDADNTANGLAGAKFGLYRVNLMDKSSSEIAVKVTTDPYFNITFSEDGKYDSLIFDTLYYYEELEAPKDYQKDPYRHFVIFRSSKFDSVIADVKDYVNEYARSAGLAKADLEIVDVENSGKTAEFVFKNTKKPEDKIVVPPEDPDDPPKEGGTTTETTTGGGTTTTTTSTLTRIFGNINPEDLPEVLGASRDSRDLPMVLGARRSATEDRDMTGSVAAIILSFAALALLLTRRDKKSKIDE